MIASVNGAFAHGVLDRSHVHSGNGQRVRGAIDPRLTSASEGSLKGSDAGPDVRPNPRGSSGYRLLQSQLSERANVDMTSEPEQSSCGPLSPVSRAVVGCS
jgi:hypothetical protein